MYSKHHAVLSFVVGALAVFTLPPVVVFGYEVPAVVVLGYATAVGVLIDLDHFCIARLRTGSWDPLRFCVRNPLVAVTDQERIFARGDVGAPQRLLSHLLIVGALVPVLALESVPLAIVTAVVLYVHLVSDAYWDVKRLERRQKRSTTERRQKSGLKGVDGRSDETD